MTRKELNALFEKKNLIEVLSYTLIGIKYLIDEFGSLPADPNYDPDVMRTSLKMALDQAEKRIIEIADK